MKDKNFIQDALNTIKIEGNAVLALRDQIKDDFERLCQAILDTKGKLILMGIGKSGHISQKFQPLFLALALLLFLFILQKQLMETWE